MKKTLIIWYLAWNKNLIFRNTQGRSEDMNAIIEIISLDFQMILKVYGFFLLYPILRFNESYGIQDNVVLAEV